MTGAIWYSIIANESKKNFQIYFIYGFENDQTPMDNGGTSSFANTIGKTVLLHAGREIETGKLKVF